MTAKPALPAPITIPTMRDEIGGFLRWVPEERRRQSPSLEKILFAVDQNADRQNLVQ